MQEDSPPVLTDPVGKLLSDAAAGTFPPSDGAVKVVGSPDGPTDAVLGFTAHHVVAADLDPDEVRAHLPDDDVGAAMSPIFLTWLGERLGAAPGMIDLVLVAMGTGGESSLIPSQVDQPRVQRALRYRSDVETYQDPGATATVTIGHGLAGRREVSIELSPAVRGGGNAVRLLRESAGLVPKGEPLFAQVTPGNVASLRAFLGAGFKPVCSEVLFLRR